MEANLAKKRLLEGVDDPDAGLFAVKVVITHLADHLDNMQCGFSVSLETIAIAITKIAIRQFTNDTEVPPTPIPDFPLLPDVLPYIQILRALKANYKWIDIGGLMSPLIGVTKT